MKREWVAVIIKSVLNNFQNVLDLLDLYFQTTKTSSVSTLFYLKNVIFNDETSNKILNFCFNLLIFSWILRILSIVHSVLPLRCTTTVEIVIDFEIFTLLKNMQNY